MPKIFPVFVKRPITIVVGGVANYLARVRAATRLTVTGTLLVPQRPAVKIAVSPSSLTVVEKPAIRLSSFSTVVLDKAEVVPAAKLTARYDGTAKLRQNPATKLTLPPSLFVVREKPAVSFEEAFIDLNHTSHVVTAAVDAGATGTWNNPTRIQGAPQGTQAGSASFAGGLLLGTGTLRGTVMVAQNNRGSINIVEVVLEWFGQTVGLPLVSDLISQLELGYRINTSPLPTVDKVEFTLTANENFLATPKSRQINTGGVFNNLVSTPVTWANIALLQPFFKATTIANGLMTYYADAIRLKVHGAETVAF